MKNKHIVLQDAEVLMEKLLLFTPSLRSKPFLAMKMLQQEMQKKRFYGLKWLYSFL